MMTPPPTNSATIYNFNPDQVGTMIAGGDWAGCWDYLANVIENLTITATTTSLKFSIQLQADMKDEEKKKYVKDIGALLGELILYLLTETASVISDKSFYRLLVFHETIHSLFYIHSMENTDAAVAAILGDGKRKLSASEQKKMLLLFSLDTELDIDKVLEAVDPLYRSAAVIAFFSHRKIFRKNVYENKEKLFRWRKELERAMRLPEDLFLSNVTAYFLSSYMNSPDKHRIKENVNNLCRLYLSTLAREFRKIDSMPANLVPLKIDRNRPTVLVIAELFSKNHAMYRGWGQLTKSIHSEFNVVFTMPVDRGDPGLAEDFENYTTFTTLGDLYQVIRAAKPDIIFMPSIGMRFYNVIISSMRFAPIQIMGLGHPAASMSEYVDYVVSPGGLYDPAAFPVETYIGDGYQEKFVPIVAKEVFLAPAPEVAPEYDENGKRVLRVAVVGSDIKVSHPFFSLLKEIVEESPFKIHVCFMMGVGGMDSLYIEKFLDETFPHSSYHGWQPYKDYLAAIKTADIVLNPFPFGHTNTVIDTLMCGKPCVGMDGIEPASKTEGDILRHVGLKELFVAKDREDYKRKFFFLAEKIRNGETEFFDREQVYNTIFAELGDYDYGKVMKWIFDNHQKIKASGKKYFDVFSDV